MRKSIRRRSPRLRGNFAGRDRLDVQRLGRAVEGRLGCELLEDRALLSADFGFAVGGTTPGDTGGALPSMRLETSIKLLTRRLQNILRTAR